MFGFILQTSHSTVIALGQSTPFVLPSSFRMLMTYRHGGDLTLRSHTHALPSKEINQVYFTDASNHSIAMGYIGL
jgi:hypothetical protein